MLLDMKQYQRWQEQIKVRALRAADEQSRRNAGKDTEKAPHDATVVANEVRQEPNFRRLRGDAGDRF